MAKIYISPTGNDTTGDGTEATPYLTINKAHDEAASGDTIYCMAGTHTWIQQAFTKQLTITGSHSDDVIFDAGGGATAVEWGTNSSITISNITFQNNNCDTYTSQLFGSTTLAALPIITYKNCVFRDLHPITHNQNWGSSIFGNVAVSGTNTNGCAHEFISCVFYDLDSASAGGVVFGFGSNTGGTSPQSYFTLTNCSLYLDTSSGVALTYLTQIPALGQTFTMVNCALKSAQALNFKNGANGVWTVTYSAVNGFTNVPAGTGNISSDPLFIDAPSGDFRLSQNSPCLDAGTVV